MNLAPEGEQFKAFEGCWMMQEAFFSPVAVPTCQTKAAQQQFTDLLANSTGNGEIAAVRVDDFIHLMECLGQVG